MNNLKANKQKQKSGLFLFFVAGLFLLQIIFAFTIHGDIGPQTDLLPILDKPASPVLIGKIDSLVSKSNKKVPLKVVPEGAFAPATKNINDFFTEAKVDTEQDNVGVNAVKKIENSRFYEYRIKSGDTLEKISKKLYGSSKMVQPLIRINRIVNDKALRVGAVIRVPHIGLLKNVKVM